MDKAFKDRLKKTTGAVKEKAGKVLGDEGLELEGKLQRFGAEFSIFARKTGKVAKRESAKTINRMLDQLEEVLKNRKRLDEGDDDASEKE